MYSQFIQSLKPEYFQEPVVNCPYKALLPKIQKDAGILTAFDETAASDLDFHRLHHEMQLRSNLAYLTLADDPRSLRVSLKGLLKRVGTTKELLVVEKDSFV